MNRVIVGLKLLVLGCLLFSGFAFLAPANQAVAAPCNENNSFFSFPTWNQYLECEADGSIDQDAFELNNVWLIAVAILDIILRVGAFVAFVMIIYGGFKYITSQGAPDATASARRTLISAIAGLVISIFATVAVRFSIGLLSGGASTTEGGITVPGDGQADASNISTVFNLVYAIAGVVAVIYIVIGGIKFTTSTGDPGKVTSARNTIIYALVGLVVVISAFLLTTAVVDRVGLLLPLEYWRLYV